MRIGIQTWGTEGDVRPFFSLAGALRDRGHDVKMVYTNVEGRDFGALAERCGIEARSVGGEHFRAHAEENAKRAQASFDQGNPLRQIRLIVEDLMDPVAQRMLEAGQATAAFEAAKKIINRDAPATEVRRQGHQPVLHVQHSLAHHAAARTW